MPPLSIQPQKLLTTSNVSEILNLMISTKFTSSPRLEADCLSYALSQVSTISSVDVLVTT
jgi:hypothetical protein